MGGHEREDRSQAIWLRSKAVVELWKKGFRPDLAFCPKN